MDNKIFDNKDIRKLRGLIEGAQNIVLTCHVRPDGDAVGCTLGLSHLLSSLGKHTAVVTPDMPPRSLNFLPGMKDLVPATKYPDYAAKLIDGADLIFCCDFNTPSRQDALAPVITGSKAKKVMVDHHEGPDSELAFRLIAALGLYGEMDRDAATCICTGIITDTRNFSVNCSNPETYEILMRLLEKGVDKPTIVRQALELVSYDSLRLQAYALNDKLEVFPQHHAAVITITLDE